MRKAIRVVIADDHPIIRDGLKKLLSREADIEVVGEASDGREALERVQESAPDVLVLDLRMPNMDGLAVLRALQQFHSNVKVIVMTASEDKNEFIQAMKLGCMGIVLKQTALVLIVKSIRKVHGGEIWMDSYTTSAVMAQFSSGGDPSATDHSRNNNDRSLLSRREREIAGLVSQGYSNKGVAEKLSIAEQTVKNHLHNIFDKLDISDRLELALYALHKRLNTHQEM